MTYREAVAHGEKVLELSHIADAKTDAWLLLEMGCKIDRKFYYMHMEDDLPDDLLKEYELTIKKRAEHIPLQYIVGETEFMGLKFKVNSNVLIPRQDTETLVEEALKKVKPGMKVLDMCTGSGCLAILLAEKFPQAEVDAVDISSEALEVAEINIADYELENRVYPIQSDLFENLQNTKYDLIISNPPYVTESSMEGLPQEYRYEPSLALVAGADGMDIIDRLLKEVKAHLNDNGVLIVELGDGAENFKERFPNIEVTWLPTSGGKDQVFMIKKEQLPNA